MALAAILMYQSTNAGLYYLIGVFIYFWAYSEGEVSLSLHIYFTETNHTSRLFVRSHGLYPNAITSRSRTRPHDMGLDRNEFCIYSLHLDLGKHSGALIIPLDFLHLYAVGS
jgi:hypothetical protein